MLLRRPEDSRLVSGSAGSLALTRCVLSLAVLITAVLLAPIVIAGEARNPYGDFEFPRPSADKPMDIAPDKTHGPCDPSGIITNCSFETGDFTGWIATDMANPLTPLGVYGGVVGSVPDGAFAAGHGFDGAGFDTIELAQDVTLWNNTTTLEFDYNAFWDMVIFGATLDRTFDVVIQPSGGGGTLQVTTVLTAVAGTTNILLGQLGSVDVSAFAGQSIRIVFRWTIPENFTGPGGFDFDNVSLDGFDQDTIALDNPSFEDGSLTAWTRTGGTGGFVDLDVYAAGSVGGNHGNNTASDGGFDAFYATFGTSDSWTLAQDVAVPFDATDLKFDYYVATVHQSSPGDIVLDVDIQPAGGGPSQQTTVIASIPMGGGSTSTAFLEGSVNLAPFRGDTMRVIVRATIPPSNTDINLDNFRIDTMPPTTLGVYFDAAFTQDTLIDPPLFVPVTAWVVAKNVPSAKTGTGIDAWEAFINLPPEVLVLGETDLPPGTVNVGDVPGEFINGLPSCTGNGDNDIALVQYTLFFSVEVSGTITIGAATPSSFVPAAAGWADCTPTLRPFDVLNESKILFSDPVISSIVDVPNDEGHWVRMTVTASGLDTIETITGYNVWRDLTGSKAQVDLSAAKPSTKLASLGAVVLDGRTFVQASTAKDQNTFPPGTWELLTSVFAAQQPQYQISVPTFVDNVPTSYFVSAHTPAPGVWYGSDLAVAGTSLDNLPPGPPTAIVAGYAAAGVDLDWNFAVEPDVQFWRVYRGTDPGFVPTPGDLIGEVGSPVFNDPTASPWGFYYKVSAVDHAGNEGPPAGPGSVTAADNPTEPKFALHDAVPNPFNPSTLIAFNVPQTGHVRLLVYNAAGRLVATLVNGEKTTGRHEITWNGRTDSGAQVASGVYIARLEAGENTQTQRMTLIK